jgi:hypothetical protein
MNLPRKSVVFCGVVAAATLLLALTGPRTVRAFGEELVRIANTETYPGIVEEVPHFASHIVTIYAFATVSQDASQVGGYFVTTGTDGTINFNTVFSVPAGQSFVITGVDINPNVDNLNSNPGGSSNISVINSNNLASIFGFWIVPNYVSTEIQYASGTVVRSGTKLWLNAPSGFGVFIHGYLTTT